MGESSEFDYPQSNHLKGQSSTEERPFKLETKENIGIRKWKISLPWMGEDNSTKI